MFPQTFDIIPVEMQTEELGKAFLSDFPLACAMLAGAGIIDQPLYSFLKNLSGKDRKLISKIISCFRDRLNIHTVFVPILFFSSRKELESFFRNRGGRVEMKEIPLGSISATAGKLRLPGKIARAVEKLACLHYYRCFFYPMACLEDTMQAIEKLNLEAWLWDMNLEIVRAMEADTGEILSLAQKTETLSRPCTKRELRDFFEENRVEPGPVRKEIWLYARDRQLRGEISGIEEFFRSALHFYQKEARALDQHIDALKDFTRKYRVSEGLEQEVSTAFGKQIRRFLFSNPLKLIRRYADDGLLNAVFPELHALKGLSTTHHHYFDNYVSHCLETLAVVLDSFEDVSKGIILAALFHDIGKPKTAQILGEKQTFHKAGREGAEMTRRICKRLGIGNRTAEKAAFLIRAREQYLHPREVFENWLRKHCLEIPGDFLNDLLRLWYADRVAMVSKISMSREKEADLDKYLAIRDKLGEWIRAASSRVSAEARRKLILTGNDLIKELFFEQGPEIGRMLRYADQWAEQGIVNSKQECLQKIKGLLFDELFQDIRHEVAKAAGNEAARLPWEIAARHGTRILQLLRIDPVALLRRLDAEGLLGHVFPEIEGLKGIEQSPWNHAEGDVYIHTLLVLQRLKEINPHPELHEIIAGLLHDIGKPATCKQDGIGHISFYRHEIVGAEMAGDFCRRFSLDSETSEAIVFLVRNHLQCFLNLPEMSTRKVKRLMAGKHFPSLLRLRKADLMAQLKPDGTYDLSSYEVCVRRLQEVTPGFCCE